MMALIAGQGDLPTRIAARCQKWPLIAALESAKPDELLPEITFRLETLGSLLQRLAEAGVHQVCFAGAIDRPNVDLSLVDQATAPLVPRIVEALTIGDDGALTIVISIFEAAGFEVIGAQDIVEEFLLPAGTPTLVKPDQQAIKDIDHAAAIAQSLSLLDVGQANVVSHNQVLAIETIGGTDWMLQSLTQRTDRFPAGGVLYKAPKTSQDLRVDVPTIGAKTFRAAASAGLSGVAIAVGTVFVVDPDEAIAEADRLELFLHVIAESKQ